MEYTIELTCHFEGEKTPLVVRLPAPLDFLPTPSGPQGYIPQSPFAEFVMKSKRFSSSRLTGAEKSFGNSFKDKFSKHTPSVDVVLKVSLPTSVTAGSSFPIYACLEVFNPSTAEISLPVAEIRVKSLEWHQQVYYRALLKSSPNSGEHEDQCTSSTALNTLPESQWVDPREKGLGEKGKVQSTDRSWYYPGTFEARIPGDTGLSLRTRNIDCGYMSELKLQTEICGKEFEFKVETGVVVVQS